MILKNISYLGVIQLLNYLVPLITIPVVSRILGVEKIGLVSYILSYITFFILIVSYSFNLTAIRELSKNNNLNFIFSLVFKSQLILFFVSSLFFILCIFLVPAIKENYILSLVTYIMVIAAIFDKNWVYQYKQDLAIVALINVLLKILCLICIILFVRHNEDYIIYSLILVLTVFFTNILLFFLSIYKFNIEFIHISLIQISRFIWEGKALFFSSIVITLYTTTSILILGIFCSNKDVGLYSAALKIVDIAKAFVIMPITHLIFPIISEKISLNESEGINYVKKLMPLFIYSALVVLVGMIIFGPVLLLILYGSEFYEAISIIIILSFTLVLILFSTVFGILIMVNLGMDNLFFKNQFYVAVFSIILAICILPYGGAKTSAIILVLSEFFITIYQYYCVKNRGYNLLSKDMWKFKSLKKSFETLKGI